MVASLQYCQLAFLLLIEFQQKVRDLPSKNYFHFKTKDLEKGK